MLDNSTHSSNYGDSYALSRDIDLMEFIRRPTTIVRLISILFAIVVFGCISAAGYDPIFHHCIFNKNQDACHYGVAIGVLAFLGCILFIAVDFQFTSISNSGIRKQLVFTDLAFSGSWSFLWFVGFCFLADQWRKSATRSAIKSQYATNHARAAIAFSFFSVFTWVTLTLMALKRYRQGDGFQNEYEDPSPHQNEYQGGYNKSPYASFPQPSGEDTILPYQQHPSYSVPELPFGVPPPQTAQPNIPDY